MSAGSPLLDLRMKDGSRHFAALPETYDVEAWIDFKYRGHSFTLNNQCNEWWFFVDDPACPDGILRQVVAHFEVGAYSQPGRQIATGSRRHRHE